MAYSIQDTKIVALNHNMLLLLQVNFRRMTMLYALGFKIPKFHDNEPLSLATIVLDHIINRSSVLIG